jgi:proteasome lid subunit RPN8/RPN11
VETLTIARQAEADIVAHAREHVPLECCGLLLGSGGRVATSFRARNAAASSTKFLVDADDHFAALRQARRLGLDVIGAYHSHPGSPPEPSPRDRREADGQAQGFVSLIVSLQRAELPELAAFVWRDGNFQPLTLVRTEV